MIDMEWSEIFILLPLSESEASSLRKILKQVYISDFGSSIVDDAYKILKKIDEGKTEMFTPLNGHHQHVFGDTRIFVFGSNVAGLHGGGAAWYAKNKLGAEWGVGEGLTGQTYALPTCYYPGEPVTYEELMVYVQNFVEFAATRLDITFFVSAVGCGIAGFSESEVAPLFKDAPANCDLPPDWRDPKCKRIIPSPIDGQFSPCSECGNDATHLFRFDYSATPGPNGRDRHRGATALCSDHFTDTKDDPRMLNEVDLMWVKL